MRRKENWIDHKWRPVAAWVYLLIVTVDFVLFPVFFAWYYYFTKTPMIQFVPLTIQGGGLFHVAFGAIIGVTSWGRTTEKINNLKDQDTDPEK